LRNPLGTAFDVSSALKLTVPHTPQLNFGSCFATEREGKEGGRKEEKKRKYGKDGDGKRIREGRKRKEGKERRVWKRGKGKRANRNCP